MFKQKKPAFTLIEILVVIAIIALTFTFGMTNFFNFQKRQKVENTAKELIVYLRRIQNYAKTGNRGQGDCQTDAKNIADGHLPLINWTTQIIGNNKLESKPNCYISLSNQSQLSGKEVVFTLPNGITITPTAGNIVFASLFGNTTASMDYIIISDDTYRYRFNFHRGTITNGDFCPPIDEDPDCDQGKNY